MGPFHKMIFKNQFYDLHVSEDIILALKIRICCFALYNSDICGFVEREGNPPSSPRPRRYVLVILVSLRCGFAHLAVIFLMPLAAFDFFRHLIAMAIV